MASYDIRLKRAGRKLIETYFKKIHPESGDRVVNLEWDNLIILDGCRLDLYQTMSPDVDSIRSRGSTTTEFLRRNFDDESYYNIVYVTANPFVNIEVAEKFHAVYSVWETHWDDEKGTVLPTSVGNVAQNAHQKHPNKRLIIHFMQPHYPFVDSPELGGNIEGLRNRALGGVNDSDNLTPWLRLRRGEVSEDRVWNAYKRNLELVMEAANELVDYLDGRSVITSDHGNAIGERIWPFPIQYYGHNRGIHIPVLVEVPWDSRSGSPRTIRSDPPISDNSYDEVEMKEKLANLGYFDG